MRAKVPCFDKVLECRETARKGVQLNKMNSPLTGKVSHTTSMIKQLRKPTMKIGNAARRAVQKEIKSLASTNPLTKSGYDLVESLIKTAKKRTKRKRERGAVIQTVTQPSAKGTVQRSGQFSANGFDTRTVNGTETFVSIYRPQEQDYDSGGLFDISANAPGLINLAREAQNYQLYRFSKMKVTYEPVSATATQGQVIFGALSDPTDPEPVSLEDARAVRDSISTPVWQRTTLTIPTDGTDRYVDGDKNSSSDVRFQVFKRLFIGSTSVSAGTPTGLWTIEYSCILTKRKPSPQSIAVLEINSSNQPFSSILSTAKSTPYYKVAPSGVITFLVSGRYRLQAAIQSLSDQALPNVVITNGGVVVPATSLALMTGYTNVTDLNLTLLMASVSFVLRTRGAQIDLSGLLTLAGNGSLMLSIEPDSSPNSI